MPRLKVMTLNLWGYRGEWPVRRDRLIRCMQDEEVDVVLLQEVGERAWKMNQALEISQFTGYAASFVPSGSSSMRSTIWSLVCRSIGRPQIGQCGTPTRAKSRRR